MGPEGRMVRPAVFLALAFGFGVIVVVGMSGTVSTIGAFGLPAPVLAAPVSNDQKVGEERGGQDSAEPPVNPHGNLVFRVTGATSCRDCHAAGRSSSAWPVLDNERVRALVAKGKGAHAGRFADCFRCHPGGKLPSEQP